MANVQLAMKIKLSENIFLYRTCYLNLYQTFELINLLLRNHASVRLLSLVKYKHQYTGVKTLPSRVEGR